MNQTVKQCIHSQNNRSALAGNNLFDNFQTLFAYDTCLYICLIKENVFRWIKIYIFVKITIVFVNFFCTKFVVSYNNSIFILIPQCVYQMTILTLHTPCYMQGKLFVLHCCLYFRHRSPVIQNRT